MMVETGVRLDCSATQAAQLTADSVRKHGMRTVRSFELRDALQAGAMSCLCHHHGTAQCTCDYIVLLVYEAEPAADCDHIGEVVIHSYEEKTWINIPVAPTRSGEQESASDPRLLRALAEVVLSSSLAIGAATP